MSITINISEFNKSNIVTIDQLAEQTVLSKADWIMVLNNTRKKTGKASFTSVVELLKGDFYTKAEVTALLKKAGGAFDWNRPISGPLGTGITPGGDSVTQGLENLFYPAVAPVCSLYLDNPTRQYGADTAITLHYSATQRTNPIATIVVDGNEVVDQAGTVTTSVAANQSKTFYMSATDGTLTGQASARVEFKHLRFWFTDAQDLTSLSDEDISSFLHQVGNAEFADGRGQTREFSPDAEYIYFAWLAVYGSASFVVNGLGDTDFVQKPFTYTNSDGYATSFLLVRKGLKLKNTFTVAAN